MTSDFKPCHFFIIGAMKAGTTSLHDDLSRHPGIFMPTLKEPGYYVGPEFGGPARLPKKAALKSDYCRIFAPARDGQLRGESSTYYSQAGVHDNVPQRIEADCGRDVKVIYLLRDPVERAISHYKHDFQRGYCTIPTLIDAVDQYPPLVLFSRYRFQIEQYLACFAPENILAVRAESYFAGRDAVTAQIIAFLGLDPAKLPLLDTDKKMNTAAQRRTQPSFVRAIKSSSAYHRYVKPFVPKFAINAANQALSAPPPALTMGAPMDDIRALLQERIPETDLDYYRSTLEVSVQ